jgi:hypothetical protein
MAPAIATYAPRDPSQSVLYNVIAEHLETFWRVPKPRGASQRLLEAVGVQLPDVLPQRNGDVVTRTKLPKRRKL